MHTGPMYSDADTAALYDRLNPWGPSDDFYLSFVMDAPSVLDVGCGTGLLLHRAREAGHTGRLCGVDPDVAALERARRWAGIEWVEAGAADMAWDREFALAVMASNVFQVFVTDEELRASVESVVGDVVTSPRRPPPATATRCASTGRACASSTSRASTRSSAAPASRSRPATATGRGARSPARATTS